MTTNISPGAKLRAAVEAEHPLQMPGVINAYHAMMAEASGYRAIYLSGSGVAGASYGLPDLGMTTLNDVVEDVRRVTGASSLPLLVDADTGWGNAFMINKAITELARAGAAGVHIEDQVQAKRCGHRPNKEVVSLGEMVDRVTAAVDAKPDPDFVVMARIDALAVEGMDSALDRARAVEAAGADMLFPEAMPNLDDYRQFTDAVDIPVLANLTEFGLTPAFTTEELASVDVAIALYPLSAFRAMNAAALSVFKTIRSEGTQASAIPAMQTRDEYYEFLNYREFEEKIDSLFAAGSREGNVQ
ncbi:MAG: methylisocitrate lyase [Chloroflexi bacterium]|nr:methylisocitrate lyase [Chloroflexota bacterium]MBT4074022.1 methylisocitrate lyase [Chloroflexota bacterium]MBT5318333.1 methylisocitrate lyase [Chloroflexota bacterium]